MRFRFSSFASVCGSKVDVLASSEKQKRPSERALVVLQAAGIAPGEAEGLLVVGGCRAAVRRRRGACGCAPTGVSVHYNYTSPIQLHRDHAADSGVS